MSFSSSTSNSSINSSGYSYLKGKDQITCDNINKELNKLGFHLYHKVLYVYYGYQLQENVLGKLGYCHAYIVLETETRQILIELGGVQGSQDCAITFQLATKPCVYKYNANQNLKIQDISKHIKEFIENNSYYRLASNNCYHFAHHILVKAAQGYDNAALNDLNTQKSKAYITISMITIAAIGVSLGIGLSKKEENKKEENKKEENIKKVQK